MRVWSTARNTYSSDTVGVENGAALLMTRNSQRILYTGIATKLDTLCFEVIMLVLKLVTGQAVQLQRKTVVLAIEPKQFSKIGMLMLLSPHSVLFLALPVTGV